MNAYSPIKKGPNGAKATAWFDFTVLIEGNAVG